MNQPRDNSKLQETLDVLDNIRDDVRAEIGDSAFVELVLKHLPQIVVTGAQSAGKSSVLTLVSGVKLPQKAERCTRVAINLKLRRTSDSSLKMTLKRPNHTQKDPHVEESIDDTALVIEKLQTMALNESGSLEFAQGYTIEVAVTGPHLPNTTLVDLPGFTTSTPEEAQMVKDIVTPYLNMENTMILHVCKGDTDYDSLLGNDVIREYKEKVIPVFTYLDRLDEATQPAVMRSIMNRTDAPRFAVKGNHVGDAHSEVRLLKSCVAFANHVEHFRYGRDELVDHMEEFQTARLREQLPSLIDVLENALNATVQRLKMIKPRSVYQVLLEVSNTVTLGFDSKSMEFVNASQRPLMDALILDLKKLDLCSTETENFEARDLEPMEELEVGTLVQWEEKEQGDVVTVEAFVRKVNVGVKTDTVGVKTKTITDYEMSTGDQIKPEDLCVFFCKRSVLLNHIRDLVKKQSGFRNHANVDPHQVLDPLMLKYADAYGKLLHRYKESFRQLALKQVKQAFSANEVSEMGKPVLEELHGRVQAKIKELSEKMDVFIDNVQDWNRPPFVFATDDFAFNAISLESLKKEDPSVQVGDEGNLIQIYHRARALIKVQRKVITEAAVKQFGLVFHKHVKKEMDSILEDMTDMEKFVKEPKGWECERTLLNRRRSILESALTKLHALKSE